MEKFCPISDSNNLDDGHGADCPTKEETMCSDTEIYFKLYEAEREADSTAVRYSSTIAPQYRMPRQSCP